MEDRSVLIEQAAKCVERLGIEFPVKFQNMMGKVGNTLPAASTSKVLAALDPDAFAESAAKNESLVSFSVARKL